MSLVLLRSGFSLNFDGFCKNFRYTLGICKNPRLKLNGWENVKIHQDADAIQVQFGDAVYHYPIIAKTLSGIDVWSVDELFDDAIESSNLLDGKLRNVVLSSGADQYKCDSEWEDWSHCSVSCGGGIRTRQKWYNREITTESEMCASEACPLSIDMCNMNVMETETSGFINQLGDSFYFEAELNWSDVKPSLDQTKVTLIVLKHQNNFIVEQHSENLLELYLTRQEEKVYANVALCLPQTDVTEYTEITDESTGSFEGGTFWVDFHHTESVFAPEGVHRCNEVMQLELDWSIPTMDSAPSTSDQMLFISLAKTGSEFMLTMADSASSVDFQRTLIEPWILDDIEITTATSVQLIVNTGDADFDMATCLWSAWSTCSKTCGDGLQVRTRLSENSETESQSKECNLAACENHQWSNWSVCSVSCGGGSRERTFRVTEIQSEVCNTPKCPDVIDYCNNFIVNEKTNQNENTVIGNIGQLADNFKLSFKLYVDEASEPTKLMLFKINNPYVSSMYEHELLTVELDESDVIFTLCLPQDTFEAESIEINQQSESMNFHFVEVVEPASSVHVCGEKISSNGQFDLNEPLSVLLQKTGSSFTLDIVNGDQHLSHSSDLLHPWNVEDITIFAQSVFELEQFYVHSGTEHFDVSTCLTEWSEWTDCSASCGDGKRTRDRIFNHETELDEQMCSLQVCLTEWSAWSQCSLSCGGGERSRSRLADDTSEEEKETCNSTKCPEWSNWSVCTLTCGGGTRSRERLGSDDTEIEIEACGTITCVVVTTPPTSTNPELTPWTDWTECSLTCGLGIRSRQRYFIDVEQKEYDECDLGACPPEVTTTIAPTAAPFMTENELDNATNAPVCNDVDFCGQAGVKQQTWCMQRSSIVSSQTFGFAGYKQETTNKVYLPEVSGHGFDNEWGAFVIQPFGEIEINHNMCQAQVLYVKRYASGWEMRIVETVPFPIPDEYESLITFKASNNRPKELSETGTFKMRSSRRCGDFNFNGKIEQYLSGQDHNGERISTVTYENFVIIPRVSGKGKDNQGRFWLQSNVDTEVEGRVAHLNYVKRYDNGVQFKIKEKVAWPISNLITIGTYTQTNKSNGKQTSGFHTLTNGVNFDHGLIANPTKRIMQTWINDQLVVFTDDNYHQYPIISGTGTSEIGPYTIVLPDCELNTERFVFAWGVCDMTFVTPAGRGRQTFGRLKYNCRSTGQGEGVHHSGESDFCSMTGKQPHLKHCFSSPTMLTLTITDQTHKPYKLRINDFQLYPRPSGSGISDCLGQFTLTAPPSMLTKRHGQNVWILTYKNGDTTRLKFYYNIRKDSSMVMTGIYTVNEQVAGQFSAIGGLGELYQKKIKQSCVVPTPPPITNCPLKCNDGQDKLAKCIRVNRQVQCQCSIGFAQSGNVCVDVDECADNSHDCTASTKCVNRIGSFECIGKSGLSYEGKLFKY